jgi:hypothetical protein
MTQDWRSNLFLPGLLEKAIRVRAKEFDYPSLSPFFTELVCFDLRQRVPHTISLPISLEPPEVRDVIEREIIRNYVPKAPRNYSLLRRLIKQLAKEGHFGAWQAVDDDELPAEAPAINPKTWPDDGPASSFRYKARFPRKLRSIIEIRWAELGYPNVSEYVTGLIRYDLMLGGPHTYFNGHDKQRYLLDALDMETQLTFHSRRKRRRILLDYMIEEVAGRPMSDEERHRAMLALSRKLRECALGRTSANRAAKQMLSRRQFER